MGYYQSNAKLKIVVDNEEIAELKKSPVPVYLFGIDGKTEKGYFVCWNNLDDTTNLKGIFSTIYTIDNQNIQQLWKEVANYWDNNNEITKFLSYFN